VKGKYPSVKLVYLSGKCDSNVAIEAFRHGASAFLVKGSPATELLTAIQEAVQDRVYISPRIAKEVILNLLEPYGKSDGGRHLTQRQSEVLQLLAGGKSMKEVAEVLKISARTVQFHKYEMMKILGMKTSVEIVRYAIHHGLISP
jgi:DNA-binding NarL/FixJ family response regulator